MPRELPDGDEGLDNLLAGILERSRNLSVPGARHNADPDSDVDSDAPILGIEYMPTEEDYPLLRVACVVSLNFTVY